MPSMMVTLSRLLASLVASVPGLGVCSVRPPLYTLRKSRRPLLSHSHELYPARCWDRSRLRRSIL
jgi:hypothetical protein